MMTKCISHDDPQQRYHGTQQNRFPCVSRQPGEISKHLCRRHDVMMQERGARTHYRDFLTKTFQQHREHIGNWKREIDTSGMYGICYRSEPHFEGMGDHQSLTSLSFFTQSEAGGSVHHTAAPWLEPYMIGTKFQLVHTIYPFLVLSANLHLV